MEAVVSVAAILFLGAASIMLVIAMLRMFKGIAPTGGQTRVRGRDHRQVGKLARSGSPVPESHAEPVREMVEQQLDMLDRSEAARPLMFWSVGLFAVGVTLFALGSDREVLPLLVLVAAMMGFWVLSTVFTTWVLRKYEATAAANGWITYSNEAER